MLSRIEIKNFRGLSALDLELAQARPLRENAFKVSLARNVLVRTLIDLAEAS